VITGHIGAAFGAKSARPEASLAWLLLATIAPDIVDFVAGFSGVCNPGGLYSHTIPAALLISLVVAGAAWLNTRNIPTALLAAGLVLVHLPLDYLTGLKYLWPGSPGVGLYIYRWPALDFVVELPVVLAGWWMLRRSGKAPRWATSIVTIALLISIQASLNIWQHFALRTKPNACVVVSRQPA
jgi:hypothetical protein